MGDISLYTGDSGLALYFAHRYLTTGDIIYKNRLDYFVESMHNTLENSDNIEVSFCSGLAGFGWFMSYLNKYSLAKLPFDYFDDIDSILYEQMIVQANNLRFDQLHESISIARYFISRKNISALEFMIKTLYNVCDHSNNESKLISYSYKDLSYHYDTGLAHGMSGILYLLSKCYQLGISKTICKELIYGIYCFYNNNELSYEKHKTFFPSSFPVYDNNVSNDYDFFCRTAWCYGDLSIFYSILMSGKVINNSKMIYYSANRLEVVLDKPIEEYAIIDAILCHGFSGVAHIFYRLFIITGNMAYLSKAIALYETTINIGQTSMNETGYNFLIDQNNKKWGISNGMLEGIAGVGLVLSSYLSDGNFLDWDESIMLS